MFVLPSLNRVKRRRFTGFNYEISIFLLKTNSNNVIALYCKRNYEVFLRTVYISNIHKKRNNRFYCTQFMENRI